MGILEANFLHLLEKVFNYASPNARSRRVRLVRTPAQNPENAYKSKKRCLKLVNYYYYCYYLIFSYFLTILSDFLLLFAQEK